MRVGGGRVRAGEDADPARHARKAALPLGRKEPFGGELALQALERDEVPADATPFDMRGVELSHHEGDCSFETFLRHYDLDEPALWDIARIVHEADIADERAAGIAQKAVIDAMALADIEVAPLPSLKFDDQAFDLVVVNARRQRPTDDTLRALLQHAHRVLRPGGRLVAMEAGSPVGVAAWLPSSRGRVAEGTADALRVAGFRAVRVLADREGYLFTEGLKSST